MFGVVWWWAKRCIQQEWLNFKISRQSEITSVCQSFSRLNNNRWDRQNTDVWWKVFQMQEAQFEEKKKKKLWLPTVCSLFRCKMPWLAFESFVVERNQRSTNPMDSKKKTEAQILIGAPCTWLLNANWYAAGDRLRRKSIDYVHIYWWFLPHWMSINQQKENEHTHKLEIVSTTANAM